MTLADDIKRILKEGQRKADEAAAALEAAEPDFDDSDDGDDDDDYTDDDDDYTDDDDDEDDEEDEEEEEECEFDDYLGIYDAEEEEGGTSIATADPTPPPSVVYNVTFARSVLASSTQGTAAAIESARKTLIAMVGAKEASDYVFTGIEEV